MPALHAFALGQLLLLLALLWPAASQGVAARCFWLLLLALSAEVLRLALPWPELLDWLLTGLRAAIPSLFWLFCLATFAERLPPKRVYLSVLSVVVLLPWLARGLSEWLAAGVALADGVGYLGQSVEFVLLGHALWVLVRQWRHDLVEARRRWRWFLLGSSALWIVSVVIAEQLIPGGAAWAQQANQWLLPAWLLACNMQLLTAHTAGLFSPVAVPVSPKPEPQAAPEAPPELARLLAQMQQQHSYRTEGLTLAALAQQVSLPQYRLRQLINSELGFRHFNAFLNHYRIAEAKQRLAASDDAATPILNIALEVGFGSLSTFNKAFRDDAGMTPSDYRRQHNAPNTV
ncbi:Helix-turn-helix domain-containing protein [Atopomonas hussainii]|uniref:Helix-turn-helix domain-containing protein n=1 Tax=Atopomonas hussainii TaxID=1429083 RepID=A0A1H7JDH7_9GAMM|nr:AraC family transcriptional regulator [Atopomonas hussainii]SEK72030.1 Helix-turn-helix domain-containing protein [Atopomonas hussainii]